MSKSGRKRHRLRRRPRLLPGSLVASPARRQAGGSPPGPVQRRGQRRSPGSKSRQSGPAARRRRRSLRAMPGGRRVSQRHRLPGRGRQRPLWHAARRSLCRNEGKSRPSGRRRQNRAQRGASPRLRRSGAWVPGHLLPSSLGPFGPVIWSGELRFPADFAGTEFAPSIRAAGGAGPVRQEYSRQEYYCPGPALCPDIPPPTGRPGKNLPSHHFGSRPSGDRFGATPSSQRRG
jgi:hypothetical protein